MKTTQYILDIDKETLISLVMRLTGGSANPAVVKGQIERIREENKAPQ